MRLKTLKNIKKTKIPKKHGSDEKDVKVARTRSSKEDERGLGDRQGQGKNLTVESEPSH
jgi:hypothetical protein